MFYATGYTYFCEEAVQRTYWYILHPMTENRKLLKLGNLTLNIDNT